MGSPRQVAIKESLTAATKRTEVVIWFCKDAFILGMVGYGKHNIISRYG